ncbi:MAG: molecular chaperone DnaJ [Anaerolineaceae bacterium]|nr:molecular chaperone DnaJ [Anaerolineaceae bacterium]
MADERDYYEILGVSKDVSDADLKVAFRQLVRKYHPDVNHEPGAEERFKEINEAYQVLSDPDKRAAYDRYGKAGVEGMGGAGMDWSAMDFSEILGDLFGFGGFGGFGGARGNTASRRNAPRRGADLQTNVKLKFEEAVFGADKEITFSRDEKCTKCGGSGAEPGTKKEKCKTCNGTGEVKTTRQTVFGSMVQVTACPTCGGTGETIPHPCTQCRGRGIERKTVKKVVAVPAGVDNGTRIRMSGEGQPGSNNGPSGDLYIEVSVADHPYFRRYENDIHLDLKINVAQAALGAEISIPTVDGEEKLRIPAGTQPGKIITMKGKGVPALRTGTRGDQKVIVDVVTPTNLTDEQRELFEKLSVTLGTNSSVGGKTSFWDRIKEVING